MLTVMMASMARALSKTMMVLMVMLILMRMSLMVGIECWTDEECDLSSCRKASSAVASQRAVRVTGTVVWRLCMSRAAMARRMGVSGTFLPPEAAGVATAEARTSRSRMRPPMPVGVSVARSTRCSLAARRARGLAGVGGWVPAD